MKRKGFFTALAAGLGATLAGAFIARSFTAGGEADAAAQGMMGGGSMMSGGMMGHATSADMRTYMDMFMHHARRSAERSNIFPAAFERSPSPTTRRSPSNFKSTCLKCTRTLLRVRRCSA